MSEQPGTPGNPDTSSSAYQAAAAQAASQVQAGEQGTDAGATVDEMASKLADQRVRAAMSDFEQQLEDLLGKSKSAFDSQQAQIDMLTRQLATVRQQAGPPVALNLAKSLAGRVASIATANPDLGTMHFAGIVSQAGQLADAVQAVADGKASGTSEAERLAGNVARWFTHSHPRASAKVLEGWHEAVNEAERIVDALPELVPVASAIASAL